MGTFLRHSVVLVRLDLRVQDNPHYSSRHGHKLFVQRLDNKFLCSQHIKISSINVNKLYKQFIYFILPH